jgi:ABC-type bacteriocin/lantibiotic exporter with double-glycine peptidase domain
MLKMLILLLFLPIAIITALWFFGNLGGKDKGSSMPSLPFPSVPDDLDGLQHKHLMCGPNSVYILLSLHDISVDYGTMEKAIPWHTQGMSLLDMRETCSSLGLKTEVRYCTIDELYCKFQSPVIACLKTGFQYHYVIVIEVTDNLVTMLDGTTGERNTVPSRWLNKFWTGYVLAPVSGFPVSWLLFVVSLFGWLLIGILALKKNRRSNVVAIVFAMGIFFDRSSIAATQLFGEQKEANFKQAAHVRMPERDAVNCLYLQLRLLGYKESYETFCGGRLLNETQSLSLKSMANIGQKLGFRIMPVKMTIAELAKTKAPVIVHFEESGVGSGRFLLFLGMDETRIDAFDGSYVTFMQISCDRFRRNWSGYALVARPPFDWQVWLRRCATILVIAGIAVWLLIGKFWHVVDVVRARNRAMN